MPPRRGGGYRSETARAQTTVDFVLGIAVFLVTVAFVFSAVAGMADPFTADSADRVISDRAADAVVDDLSAAGSAPGTLNATCTIAMVMAPAVVGCPIDPTVSISDQLGVADRYRANVSVVGAAGATGYERLCTDGVAVTACTPSTTRLVAGVPLPQTSETVATASRTVFVDGRTAVVRVRVWS